MTFEEYEKTEEFDKFINCKGDWRTVCGCCHKDLSALLTPEKIKKLESEPLTLWICKECEKNSFCKKTYWRPHPHTIKGKKWLLYSEINRHTVWLKHCDKYDLPENDPMRLNAEKSIKFWEGLKND